MYLSFDSLKNGELGVSEAWGAFCAEAAECCLEVNVHSTPVIVAVTGDTVGSAQFAWTAPNQISRESWEDFEEAAEFGAIAVAIVLALKLTGISRVRRSAKGPGMDFRIGNNDDARGIFQDTARLEISGILKGSEPKVRARLTKKLAQLGKSDATQLPGYAAIIEFGSPEACIVRKLEHEERL